MSKYSNEFWRAIEKIYQKKCQILSEKTLINFK